MELQSALDLESFWQACLKLVTTRLPHRSCSLMFNIVDFEPTDARHHVARSKNPNYMPATSLTVSSPFLARHPQIKLYTYSQIVSEDPDARRRRIEQEPDPEWNEFIHLAFWHDRGPEAVFSIHWPPDRENISGEERAFLEQLHPMIEAGLRRLRKLEVERARRQVYEHFLQQVPLSVMFVDGDGEMLFATPEAERQCARWNRALRSAVPAELQSRLPQQVTRMYDAAPGSKMQAPPAAASVRLAHPSLENLAIKIDRSWHFPGLQLRPCYVITFLDSAAAGQPAELSQAAMLVLQQLSPSERRVAQLVARGLRNEQIAEHLCRSRRTIEFQLNSVYRKLGISSRTQLARALT
ncbi:MAG TPA: helix-turn-helix transcriptional regulator [Nevskiaceae bacterium]|nr:helix-turn-helix transcriptional regulator [Nevskiaceae bacterium]